MVALKTKLTTASVDDFLNAIKDEQVRSDSYAIAEIMGKAARAKPRMWGAAIIGFGSRKYRYPDGREMDWMVVAFSPRKQNIALYIAPDVEGCEDLMAQLGKHSRGKSCLYIKRLSDVHIPTLEKIIEGSVRHVMRKSVRR